MILRFLGSRLKILWYLQSKVCAVDFPGAYDNLEGRDALLFLSSGREGLRAYTDDSYEALPVMNFTSKFAQDLAKWKDSNQAVTYLVLTPGMIIAKQDDANSHFPGDVTGLLPFREFLNIYRVVYEESDLDSRGKIAIHLWPFGHCVDMAVREAKKEGLEVWFLMDQDARRQEDEIESTLPTWSTKAALLKSFRNEQEAIDELITRACSSYPNRRRRARELLERYFGIKPSTLPCVPCEP